MAKNIRVLGNRYLVRKKRGNKEYTRTFHSRERAFMFKWTWIDRDPRRWPKWRNPVDYGKAYRIILDCKSATDEQLWKLIDRMRTYLQDDKDYQEVK